MAGLYDNFLDELERELGEGSEAVGYAQGLKGSLSTAFDKDPDKEMEIRRQAEQAGVPEEVLHNPEARKQVEIENLTETLARRPVSQDFMSDPRNAALVMDDVEKLGEIEDESSFFGGLLNAMDEAHDFLHENVTEPIVEFGEENIYDPGKAAFTQGRMVHALGKAGHELRTETDPAEKAKINQRIRELQYDMEELGVSNEGWVGFVASAAEIVGQQVSSFAQPEAFQRLSQGALAGGMVGAAAGSVVPVVGTGIGAGVGLAKGTIAGAVGHFATDAFIQESGHAYIELLEEEGIDQQAAENLAIGVGVINAGLEIAGVSMIAAPLKRSLSKYFREAATEGVKRASRTKAVRNAVRGYGIAVGGETATEIMQEATNIAAEEIGKNFFADGPVREFSFDETVDRLEEIATKTFKGMALLALPGAGVSYVSDRSKARASLRASESFSRLHSMVGESQLARRSPEAAAQHVEKAMGIDAVQMPVARFQDMLLDMGAPAEGLLPSKRFVDTFNEASEIGGDVTIPAGNFVRALLMPENKALFEKYEQHVRWRPGQMTAAEALEFQTKGMSEAMAGRVADLAGAQQTAVEDIVVGDRLDTMQSEVRAALEDLPGAMPGMPTKVSNIVRRETEAFIEETKAPPELLAQTRVPSAEEITQAVQGIEGPVTPQAIAEVLAPLTTAQLPARERGGAVDASQIEGVVPEVEQTLAQTIGQIEGIAPEVAAQTAQTIAQIQGAAPEVKQQFAQAISQIEGVAPEVGPTLAQTIGQIEGIAPEVAEQTAQTIAQIQGVAPEVNQQFAEIVTQAVPQEAPAQEAEQQVEPPSLEERVFNSQELAEALPSEAEAVLRAALKEQGEQVEMAVEEAKLVEEQVATRASVEPEVDPDIGTALDSLGLQALFRTAREAGMTEKQYETYQGALQKRANAAANRKRTASLRRERAQVSKQIKAEQEALSEIVEAQVRAEPVYSARYDLEQRKETLDRKSIIDAFGKDNSRKVLNELKKAGVPVSRARKKSGEDVAPAGIDIETYASLYDFPSGVAMVTAMRTAEPEKTRVQRLAREKTKELHPELFSKKAEIGDAIVALTQEDDSSAVIAAEIEALSANRRLGRVKPAIVREIARRNLQDHTIKDIQVNKYINNARTQGLEAGKLLRKGDRKGAREAKVNQLLNMEFIKEAEARRAQVRDGHKYMSRFLKSNRQFPSVDSEFVGAIRDLLGQYSLGPKLSPNKKAELEKFVEKAQADGANFTFPERLLEDQKTNYQDMTLHDFNLLVQKVKELHHAGREVRAEDQQNRENTIAIRVDAVTNALAARPQVETDLETRGKAKKVGKAFREMELLLLNADTVVRDLDNFEELGPVYQAIKRPIDRSTTDGYGPKTNVGLVNRQKQIAEKLLELYKVYTPSELNSISKRDIQVDGFRKPMSRNAFLSILLNSGNEQNRQAMTDSGQLTADQIQAVIDHADKRDLDFVQSVWDYLDSFWGEIEAATERRRGFKPEKVESYAMETDHGIYRGGYFPLRYDNDKGINDTRSASIEEQISQIRYGKATASHTRHDHTEERIGSGGRPVLFDMFSVHSHLDQVAYDLELGDAVNEVYATLYNPRTKKAFRDAGRAETWKALDLWLGDVVTGEMHQGGVVEKSLRWLRAGFTVSKLGWNVGVAAIQPVGILQTSVQIGKANTLAGLGLMMTRPWIGKNNIFEHVSTQSNVMAQREETFHKDIADASSLISDSYIKRHLPRGTSEFVTNSLFYGIRKTQRFVDTWTWLAAKRDGMRRFENDEARAVEYADRMVVRSQASGNFQERTAFERGSINPKVRQSELVRAFTALISYFMAKNNVAYERTKKTNFKNPGQVIGWATDMMLLYVVEAAIVGIIRGAWPDEDEAGEEYGPQVLAYLGAEGANSLFAGIPMVREFVSEAAGFRGGGVFSSVVADVAKVTEQIGQGEIDQALLTSANNLGGTLFKYPSGQINKTARALALEAEGEDVSWIEYFMGPQFDKYEK